MIKRIFTAGILIVIFCAFGCSAASLVESRVERYGVSFSIPPLKKLKLLNGLNQWTTGMYASPYGINYSWTRPREWEAFFSLDFELNPFAGQKYSAMNKNTVKKFLVEDWKSVSHLEVIEITVEDDDRFHRESYRFKYTKRYVDKGNLGQILRFEGYLMVHPFDPEYLVILQVYGHYDTQAEEADLELGERENAWFASMGFAAPSIHERDVMREHAKWIMPHAN